MAVLHELEAVRAHRVLVGDGGWRRIVRERSHCFLLLLRLCRSRGLSAATTHPALGGCAFGQTASGWLAGAAFWKALCAGAGRIHGGDLRVSVERNVEAPRIEDLRNEIDIGERGPGAEGKGPGSISALDGIEALTDPMGVPFVGRGLIVPEPILEVGDRA